MEIRLYNNYAESNRVDKTPYLLSRSTITGTLRNESSIVNPTILVDVKGNTEYIIDTSLNRVVMSNGTKTTILTAQVDFSTINYAYIDEFNRYYFITDVVVVNDRLIRLELKCDVLMSFKSILLQHSGLVARNEFQYNIGVNDNQMTFKAYPNVNIVEIPNDLLPPDITKGTYPDEMNYEKGCNYVLTTLWGYDIDDRTDTPEPPKEERKA